MSNGKTAQEVKTFFLHIIYVLDELDKINLDRDYNINLIAHYLSQNLGVSYLYLNAVLTKLKATISWVQNGYDAVEFVNSNSDVPYDSTYVAKKDLPAVDADKLYNLAPGAIHGPYMNGKYYCISKSLGRKVGVNAKASHILISYEGTQVPNKKEQRTKEQAKAKAEAILAQVNANPDSFLMLAFTNSTSSGIVLTPEILELQS